MLASTVPSSSPASDAFAAVALEVVDADEDSVLYPDKVRATGSRCCTLLVVICCRPLPTSPLALGPWPWEEAVKGRAWPAGEALALLRSASRVVWGGGEDGETADVGVKWCRGGCWRRSDLSSPLFSCRRHLSSHVTASPSLATGDLPVLLEY